MAQCNLSQPGGTLTLSPTRVTPEPEWVALEEIQLFST